MMSKLAWVALLGLWIATFGWMSDLEKRQRMMQDIVNIQSQNQKMMIKLIGKREAR